MRRGMYFHRRYFKAGEKEGKKAGDEKPRGFIPDPHPVGVMHNATKARLEEVRLHTPRYLFRAFNNTRGPHTSGGHVDLNTIDAITPLAFRNGRGHSNVYDLSMEEFATMVDNHVQDVKGTFETELSSWSGSLCWAVMYALKYLGGNLEDCYISIIDTKALWHQNQIFFVPDLHFLVEGVEIYHFEYLAHGVIRGPDHYALQLSRLEHHGCDVNRIARFNTGYRWARYQELAVEMVEQARHVGRLYGSNLALPMTLALLCVEKRHRGLFDQDEDEMEVLLEGLVGFPFPKEWINDSTITQDIVFTGDSKQEHYPDLRQFIHLMRAIVTHGATQIARQNAGWTEKPLLKIGGTGNATRVIFRSFAEKKETTEDYSNEDVKQQQRDDSDGYPSRSRKRAADFDEEMEDVEEWNEESTEVIKGSRVERESKKLRTEMRDDGKARDFGHYGSGVGRGLGRRRG